MHGLAQILIEIRKRIDVRHQACQFAHLQPLIEEIVDQRSRSRIGQHAPHLLLEHGGNFEFSGDGCIQKLVVRYAAPQKKRQP